MTIQQIKDEFEFPTLMMVRQFDLDGSKTEWVSHWDNERRIRVTMHESVMEKIRANPNADILDYKTQVVEAKENRKEYKRIVIIIVHKPRNTSFPYESFSNRDYSYEKYNGAFGYDDDAIDDAFGGDPSNCWNVD